MPKTFTLLLISLTLCTLSAPAQTTALKHLSSYATGEEGSAETVAYDPASQRAFLTNSSTNSISIVDVSNPVAPTLFADIDLSPYGGGPNSVDVHGGLVAVAIENTEKTEPGVIAFFDTDGNFMNTVPAGALPDMLTFTPDGTRVIIANEGEPNDEYTVDPPGGISIIDLSAGLAVASSTLVDFAAYNDRKASLQNEGVRIFGNDGMATVSEDLEPEYVAVNEDGSIAYVNCQENNALAVIDLTTNNIIDILPLGYKNHALGTPQVASYVLNEIIPDWPSLGTPVYDGGQDPVLLGGFSGLFFDANASTADNYVFYAIPDRGPNADAVGRPTVTPEPPQNLRPFKLPDYQARIVEFSFNVASATFSLVDSILLYQDDASTPISGRGNIPGFDEVPVTYADPNTNYANEDYVDADGESYHALPYDPFGGDFEGILKDNEGNFWMCDEYRPAIYKFQADGILKDRYVPEGTSMLGSEPQPAGTYGNETLPAVYAKRRSNRGFEAIAYDPDTEVIYAFIQSPLENPDNSVRNNTDVIRILGIDADNGTPVAEYIYLLEQNQYPQYASSRVDKIGDAFYTGNGKFLVLERDSEDPAVSFGKKYVFEIDLTRATNILGTPLSERDGSDASTPLEAMTADEIVGMGILPVQKLKVVNLPSIGYRSSDKPEGIALLPGNKIAVLNDNDFGLAGTGVTDRSVLGIISFADDYGLDASNQDDAINISAYPMLGMFLPDGIATYQVNGVDYIVTVNEGDARDYDGYSEEERVADLTLDPAVFPNADSLQDDAALGRLKTTTAKGDYDGDGLYEEIYSYGGRSFSIFDQYGNLVYDSGDAFARQIAEREPDLFNEDEGEFDGRSDDKGGEPEAIEIGSIGEFTYAFIGLERQSAILMFDITDPYAPKFITYYNNRTVGDEITGDISPEIIRFIAAEDSPNGENLLLVGYEVSGSMGIIQVGGDATSVSNLVKNSDFKLYPNPLIGQDRLNFDQPLTGSVCDMQGKMIFDFQQVNNINTGQLEAGIYIIRTEKHGTQRFVKL